MLSCILPPTGGNTRLARESHVRTSSQPQTAPFLNHKKIHLKKNPLQPRIRARERSLYKRYSYLSGRGWGTSRHPHHLQEVIVSFKALEWGSGAGHTCLQKSSWVSADRFIQGQSSKGSPFQDPCEIGFHPGLSCFVGRTPGVHGAGGAWRSQVPGTAPCPLPSRFSGL